MDDTDLAGFPGTAAGDGPAERTVVFLHGAWTTHRCFDGFVEYFGERGWNAHAPSRRGRAGVGPDRCRGLRVEDYLDDTRAVLDALGRSPVVVGHSLGGLLAQVMAAEGRCAAAVLIEPGPPKGVPVLPKARTWPMFARLAPRVMTGRPFRPSRGGARRAFLNCFEGGAADRVYDGFIDESGKAFRQVLLGFPVDTAAVSCPVLCVVGGEARAITPSMVGKTAAIYRAELMELDGHSHWMMAEPGWELVAARIEGWASAVVSRATGRHPAAADGSSVTP